MKQRYFKVHAPQPFMKQPSYISHMHTNTKYKEGQQQQQMREGKHRKTLTVMRAHISKPTYVTDAMALDFAWPA